jgi:AcrR family transcriptional regulator
MRTLSDNKRLDILRAAGKVFPKKGFHKTLVDDVAREAGIGKGTIYRYFSHKEDLFFTILENAMDEMHRRMISVRKIRNNPENVVAGMLEALADFVTENRPLLNLMHEIEGKEIMKRAQKIKAHNHKVIKALADELEEGARNGKFKRGDYALWAGMMAMASRGALHCHPEISKRQAVKNITDLFFYGIIKSPKQNLR